MAKDALPSKGASAIDILTEVSRVSSGVEEDIRDSSDSLRDMRESSDGLRVEKSANLERVRDRDSSPFIRVLRVSSLSSLNLPLNLPLSRTQRTKSTGESVFGRPVPRRSLY